jgi:hypothetical protein
LKDCLFIALHIVTTLWNDFSKKYIFLHLKKIIIMIIFQFCKF